MIITGLLLSKNKRNESPNTKINVHCLFIGMVKSAMGGSDHDAIQRVNGRRRVGRVVYAVIESTYSIAPNPKRAVRKALLLLKIISLTELQNCKGKETKNMSSIIMTLDK